VGDLHDLDVRLELEIWRSVVKRDGKIDARDTGYERNQLGLAPNDDLPRYFPQRPRETNELNRVAKAVIAANQDLPAAQFFTPPDPLLVARSLMLGTAASLERCQTLVADRPRPIKVAGAHRGDPIVGRVPGTGVIRASGHFH
jgi:hypothetical protein